MGCVTREILYAYAEDDLSSEEKRRVKAHLSTCARCRGELLLLRRIDEALAEEPLLEPTPGFTRKVMAQVRLRPKWDASRWHYLAWAAVVAIVVGLSLWIDERTDLGPASESLWTSTANRVEETFAPIEAKLAGSLDHVTDWTGAWERWMSSGLETIGEVGARPWFLPVVLISLVGFALYQLLEVLYYQRELDKLTQRYKR